MQWTEKRLQQAMQMRAKGASWSSIGEKLGCTGIAARAACYKRRRQRLDNDVGNNGGIVVSEQKKAISSLEKQLEAAQKSLEKARKPRAKLNPKQTRSAKGSFVRVIIPDTHGCFIDPDAAAAFLADLKSLAPREIVMLGDHVDCGGFLAQHHVWGYVAEADYSFDDDVNSANDFLDSVQNAAPSAKIYYLEGNHERRIENWCVTQGLRRKIDAEFLQRMFSVEHVLSLDQRGITHIKQGETYGNCRKPSTLKLGECYFTHGEKSGVHAAHQTLKEFGSNVVFGHIHKSQEASSRTVTEGVIRAYCPGFLGRLQPMWRHASLTDWNHGYGVQFVNGSGEFLHINVPIIDGKSFIVPLTKQVA